MQSASSSFAARFQEDGDVEDSRRNDHGSGDSEDESEVRSMTAKGINHLCTELLELKAESNGDFHRIIISNCVSFSRAFKRVKILQQNLVHLKSNISTHTHLIKDLMDGMDLEIESDETMNVTLQSSEYSGVSRLIELEARIYEISNALDILISESRIDEALEILKLEDENLHRMKVEEDDYPIDIVMLYDCVISDKKARIKVRLERVSDNGEMPAGGEIVPTTDRPSSMSFPTTDEVSEEI